jgi:hypothetical protein
MEFKTTTMEAGIFVRQGERGRLLQSEYPGD